jgi:hypothetical protein
VCGSKASRTGGVRRFRLTARAVSASLSSEGERSQPWTESAQIDEIKLDGRRGRTPSLSYSMHSYIMKDPKTGTDGSVWSVPGVTGIEGFAISS